jgi:diguanylate cyclase (GGDEF)-like protein/PAS domain S-box-containing protein
VLAGTTGRLDAIGALLGSAGINQDAATRRAGDAVICATGDGLITFWNPSAEALLGYAAAEMVGRDIDSLATDGSRDRLRAALPAETLGQSSSLRRFPFALRDSSGRTVPVEIDAARWQTGGQAFLTLTFRHLSATAEAGSADAGRFDPVLENGPLVFFIWKSEEDWPVEYVSRSVADFGYTPEDFYSGRVAFVDLVHPDDFERVANESFQFDRSGTPEYRQSYRVVCRNRDVRWIDIWTLARRDADGRISHHIGLIADVTEQKRVEEALRESEEKFRAVVEQSRDGIAVWTPDGRVALYNKAMEKASGYTREEVNRDGWYNLVFPDPEIRDQAIRTTMRVMLGKVSYFELPIVRKDGETAWLSFSFTPVEVAGKQYNLSVTTDVTHRKQQEQRLAYLSTHDVLTGLPNRRWLEEALKRAVGRVERGEVAALLWVDVDNLKLVNDSLGHLAGDRVLTAVAGLLRDNIRREAVIARVGGDEFAVLLEDTPLDAALAIAEHLRSTIDERHFEFEGHGISLGVSIGLAVMSGGVEPSQVLSQADIAMCRAKEYGRNRVVVYRPEEDDLARTSEAGRLVIRLKDALRQGRFLIHYQPIVRLSSGKIEHYEALIRLRDETGGLILPGSFIFAAERFGLMPQLTRWLVTEIVHRLRLHPRIRVFINLSAHCLADEGLLSFIERSLSEGGVEASRLGFEITETVMVQDLALAERWIQRLKSLGCLFALDDFGSGYSSLVYLRNLPVDQLKIDGSLVRTIETDPIQRVFVQVIQSLGAATGKEVVAEFVENEGIAVILRGMGVALGQGYHLGRPSPNLPMLLA